MPSQDYDARALALPIDEPPPSSRRSISPAWTRRSARRSIYGDGPESFKDRMFRRYETVQRQVVKIYKKLTPVQRILVVTTLIIINVLVILFLVFNERIFQWVTPVAKRWRDMPFGWAILWALIFCVSFPPLLGYAMLVTITGFVFGFPNGWFIAATATVAGSTTAFILSRGVLRGFVERLLENDTRFAALALVLKHDGLKLLIMIRLSPLPYSPSNGALSTFPTITPMQFAIATAAATPKLMLGIFVGAQLGILAEKGGQMDAKTRAVSWISMIIGVTAGIVTGSIMYKKTKQRVKELEAQERANARRVSHERLEREYADDPDALEAAETLREDEDDISLRNAYLDEEQGYRDELTDVDDDAADVDIFDPGEDDEVDDRN
ncbi:hypothetical protein M501DRAFT_1007473 [Patellaria atrata CBS 101060]|uniref:Golgi apparatus membrane protein TVP38 n=1 Tax=Patellaria atrata CBS 101060 TaxID=1346257 RepID=A0A9P4S525_9PEZI|nr:hypothetical protein M501DRAFT_1007473 [Patellaria atrata CBS 101060]